MGDVFPSFKWGSPITVLKSGEGRGGRVSTYNLSICAEIIEKEGGEGDIHVVVYMWLSDEAMIPMKDEYCSKGGG